MERVASMNWLKKLPDTHRSPSGLEWALWRKLPLIALAGTLLPLLCWGGVYLLNDAADGAAGERWVQMTGYMVLGAIFFHWAMVLAVAIGCVIVMVMKGPAYVADGYQVSHRDQPRATMETAEEAASRRPAG
jgi:hypothetical protein